MQKYVITNIAIDYDGRRLHRIRAVRDFGLIKAGDLGGFIEKEDNLSHGGTSWVWGNSKACGGARVTGHAMLSEGAVIRDQVYLRDCAIVKGAGGVIRGRETISGYTIMDKGND